MLEFHSIRNLLSVNAPLKTAAEQQLASIGAGTAVTCITSLMDEGLGRITIGGSSVALPDPVE